MTMILIIAWMSATSTVAQTGSSSGDRDALIALYTATDGPNWTSNTNWLTDRPLTNWYGIATDANGRVTELALTFNGLKGQIPPELGKLSELRVVALGSNGLSGPIPLELTSLSNLETLTLVGNNLTGQVPPELSKLPRLTVLNLGSNDLTGQIPIELSRIPELQWLSLGYNQLTGHIPPELGSLSNLKWLYLAGNQLSGQIPSELGELHSLQRLHLDYNELTGQIPVQLGRLSKLQWLGLESNRLTGQIPAELGNLRSLQRLYMGHNELTGQIPTELGSLPAIQWMHLQANRLTGQVPTELTNLVDLKELNLDSNQLTGQIPRELGVLSELRLLYLGWNQLTGQIPPDLGNLSNLEWLALSRNKLIGQIPTELARLSNLEGLFLSGNQLTGRIPVELSNLSNLTRLNLERNRLTGEIPPELSRLPDLFELRLADNQLTGQIPTELGSLDSLTHLTLDDNQLTGQIPAELGSLASLGLLTLQDNRLSGSIPPELGRLSDLRWLILADNLLSGPIPPALGNLSNLTLLRISGNMLSGDIPDELGRLVHLQTLHLANSNLTGCIPGGLRAAETNDLNRLGLPFCDVLLDGLVVSPGAPAPSFDRYRPGYTAEVSTPIATVLPISRRNATFQFLGEDGHELADADAAVPGIQISTGTVFTRVTIRVVSADGAATHTYTIEIRRVLGAPSIGAVEAGGGYIAVSWAAPDEFAEAKTASYDLRYIPTADDETVDSNWTVVENVPTDSAGGNPRYTITGLSAGTQYEVRVRAVDRDGEPAAWSASVTGTPTTPSVCVTEGAVKDVTNTGTISDCESLLAARDILAGSGRLNWSASTPIKDWDGVTVGGTRPRVVGLSVNSRGLDGTIPAELGDLTGLQRLHLFENRLTGPIPAALGKLADLQSLNVGENRLTGQVPLDLARLANLRSLDLSDNELTGVIPSQFGDLDNLVEVDLAGNDLRGCAPPVPDQHGGPQCFADEGMTLAFDTSYLLRDDQLRVTSVGDASNGVVTLDGTTITYRHDGSETKTGGFSYTASNGTRTVTSLVTITVSPVNDPPVGVDDALAVREGDTVSVQAQQLLANDSDAEGDTLNITAVGDATNGLVALDGSTIIYTHDGSETNSGSFTYTVSDSTDSTTALVTIAVSPVNDPPVGEMDALAVREGGTVPVEARELLANDSDAEGDTLNITAVGDATNGLVALDGSTIIYTHDGSETDTGSFTYGVTDGADSANVLVTVAVSPVNDPPTGVDDALAVREGDTVSAQAIALLSNDSDAEGDTLSITAVGGANNGLVTLDGSTVFYRHDGSETTSGSFAYTVSDGIDSTTALVTVAVSPVNDPPTGVDDTLAVQEGGTVSVRAIDLLANDTDAEGDTLTISAVGDAINGAVTLDGSTISYEHNGSETTTGSFTYTVTDGTESAVASVTVTVSPVNDPPVGVDDTLAVREAGTLSVASQQLLANDTDAEGDALRITAVGDAINGVVTLDGGAISYEHDGSETVTGGFTYTASDGTDSTIASVAITVSPVNDPPSGVDDALAVREGDKVSVASQQLLNNDSDAEGDALRITAVGDAVNGLVTLDGGAISYEHDGSETTTGGFTYTVSDRTDSATVLVSVTVSPVDDLPVLPLVAAALGTSLLALAVLATIVVRRGRQGS